METRGGKVERREVDQGFRSNMRDLDAEWVCSCCGLEGEKGRKCVSVLDFDVGGYWGRRV
jgi:hypothetical protein